MICIFQSLSRYHFKTCKYFTWNITKNKFRFSLSNLSFLKIKYMQLNAPDVVYLEKGLTNDKNDLWQNLKTRVSAIIKELTIRVYCKCKTTWVICTWTHNLMEVFPYRQHLSILLHVHACLIFRSPESLMHYFF